MQGPGSEGMRHSASPPPSDRSGSTRPTCAMSQVGRSRFTIGGARMHEHHESVGAERDDADGTAD